MKSWKFSRLAICMLSIGTPVLALAGCLHVIGPALGVPASEMDYRPTSRCMKSTISFTQVLGANELWVVGADKSHIYLRMKTFCISKGELVSVVAVPGRTELCSKADIQVILPENAPTCEIVQFAHGNGPMANAPAATGLHQ